MSKERAVFTGFESPNYTQTPNDFYDKILLSEDITLAEIKILGFMIRYTYGWQRAGNSLQFSFTELQKACHLGREAVNNGLKKLLRKNYIQRKEIDGHMKYRLHIKDFSDYPWSVEFNWKQVFQTNQEQEKSLTPQGQFGNRTSSDSESLEQQEEKDSLKKDLNKNINKKEEEEENARARKNIAYQILEDYLQKKGIEQQTINKTILELIDQDLDLFLMEDVEKQFKHMMEKQLYGERIFDFAKYFAKGLKELTVQSNASRQYQKERLREYEMAISKRQEKIKNFPICDWLNAK